MTDMNTIYKFLASRDWPGWVDSVESAINMDAFVDDMGDNMTVEHMESILPSHVYTAFTIHHSDEVEVFDESVGPPMYMLSSHLCNPKGEVVGTLSYVVSDVTDAHEFSESLSDVMSTMGLVVNGDVAHLV